MQSTKTAIFSASERIIKQIQYLAAMLSVSSPIGAAFSSQLHQGHPALYLQSPPKRVAGSNLSRFSVDKHIQKLVKVSNLLIYLMYL